MATITSDTYLDGGTARTAGEAWTINGGLLTVRTDTRWHANAPASMTGSLGSQTVSSTLGGGILLDGRDVRWVAITGGSGTPAWGDTVGQGANVGYYLGFWSSLTATPSLTIGATGFIKIRSLPTPGGITAGALTFSGAGAATAAGADKTGWIEVVMDQSAITTISRKGSGHVTRGDWFYLDDTDGTVGQTFQVPTNGGGAGTHCPGLWVEREVGLDEYDFWPALNGSTNGWAAQHLGMPDGGWGDERQQFVKTNGNGVMQMGETFTSAALTYTITSSSGTYTWAANVVSVSLASHGYSIGEEVHLDFTSGGATANDGIYFVTEVTSATVFKVALSGSGASGNVTLRGRAVISYPNHPFAIGNVLGVVTTTGSLASGAMEVLSVVTGASGTITVKATPSAGTGGACTIEQIIGHVPSAGRKTRIPNVFLRQCATGTRATNATPNATIANRPDFNTAGAGVIDHEYAYGDWYYVASQPYQVKLIHCATFDQIAISECAAPLTLTDGGCGMYGALDAVVLSLTSNFAGGTITDWHAPRGNTPGANDHACSVTTSLGLNFVRGRYGIIQFARSSGYAIIFSQCRQITLTSVRTINMGINLSTSTGISIYDLDYCDRYVGYTGTAANSAIVCTAKTAGVVIDGIAFGVFYGGELWRVHPYTSALSVTASDRITMMNVGAYAAPATDYENGSNVPNSVWSSGGNNADITVKRCYFGYVRSGPSTTVNSDKNVLEESVYGILLNTGLPSTITPTALNHKIRGMGAGQNSVAANASVYGTHIYDIFTSPTVGRLVLVLNEDTAETSSQVSIEAGSPQFTSAPGLSMPTIGDQVVIEMDYFALGHLSLQNAAPTLTGTLTGNMTYEYQIDDGTGYNGSWLTLNGTNLSSHTIDPYVGFKMKFRITTVTANTTNTITHVRILTDSDATSQEGCLYPLSTNTLEMTGLKNPTEVRIFEAGTTTEIGGQDSVTSGTFSTQIDGGTYPSVDISIISLGYQNTRLLSVDVASGNVSIPVQQVIDRQYAND